MWGVFRVDWIDLESLQNDLFRFFRFFVDFARLWTLFIFVADDEIVELLVFLIIHFAKPDELTGQAS